MVTMVQCVLFIFVQWLIAGGYVIYANSYAVKKSSPTDFFLFFEQ